MFLAFSYFLAFFVLPHYTISDLCLIYDMVRSHIMCIACHLFMFVYRQPFLRVLPTVCYISQMFIKYLYLLDIFEQELFYMMFMAYHLFPFFIDKLLGGCYKQFAIFFQDLFKY